MMDNSGDLAERLAQLVEGLHNRLLGLLEEGHPYRKIIDQAENLFYDHRRSFGFKEARQVATASAIRAVLTDGKPSE